MNQLGIPIQILNGIDDTPYEVVDAFEDKQRHPLEKQVKQALDNNSIKAIAISNFMADGGLNGNSEILGISGFDGLGSIRAFEDALLKHIVKTKELIEQNPDVTKGIQDRVQSIQMLDYAIDNWNTPNREKALDILAEKEADLIDSGHITVDTESLSGFDGLGGFWSKVKKAVKKVGGAVKKVAKKAHQGAVKIHKKAWNITKKIAQKSWEAVKKFNPLSVAVRNGFLLALRTNMFKIADKLAVGYLSKSEALKRGISESDWKEAVNKIKKVEDLHTKKLGGQAASLKKAILSGKRKWMRGLSGLSGFENDGLGEPATAAGTAAASGIIATVVTWLKKLKPLAGKLVKGASSLIKKDPRKKELQEQYGKKVGKEIFQKEKADAKTALTEQEEAMREKAMAEYEQMTANQSLPVPETSYTPPTQSQLPVINEFGSNDYYNQVALKNTPATPVSFGAKIKSFAIKYKKPLLIGLGLLVLTGGGFFVNKQIKKRKRKTTPLAAKKPTEKAALEGVTKVELS